MKKVKRLTKEDRAKLIEEAIRLVYDSLDSHLSPAAEKKFPKPTKGYQKETAVFHRLTVAEYARLIDILSKLY